MCFLATIFLTTSRTFYTSSMAFLLSIRPLCIAFCNLQVQKSAGILAETEHPYRRMTEPAYISNLFY